METFCKMNEDDDDEENSNSEDGRSGDGCGDKKTTNRQLNSASHFKQKQKRKI